MQNPVTEPLTNNTLDQSSSALRTGWLFAIVTTFVYSFQPIVLKLTLNEGVGAADLLFVRLLIASVLFLIMSFVRGLIPERLPNKAIFWCMLCGLSFVLGMYGYTTALNYSSASIASMIFSVFPIVTLIILTFMGEKFTIRKGIRIAFGLFGVYLIIGPGGSVHINGVLFALAACCIYACYLVIMQRSLSQYKGRTIMLYITGFTALFFGLLNLGDGVAFNTFTPTAWWLILYQASIGTYVAQLLLFEAVKHIGSGQFSLLFPLELFLTILWSVLLLSENISTTQAIGGAFIILSLLLAINNPKFIRRRIFRPRI